MKMKYYKFIVISGLIIGLLGLLGFSFWNLKNTSSIQVKLEDVFIIINSKERTNEMIVEYNNKKINSLYVMRIIIKNNGGNPILINNIIEPISIRIEKTNRIIDAKFFLSKPENINKKLFIDKDKGVITTSFNLLNPGDHFGINIFMENYTKVFKATGEVTGIESIDIREGYLIPSNLHPPKKSPIQSLNQRIKNAFYTVILFGFVFSLYHFFKLLLEVWIKNKYLALSPDLNRWETRLRIYNKFRLVVEKKDLNSFCDEICSTPDDKNFSGENEERIKKSMTTFFNNYGNSKSESFEMSLFSFFGSLIVAVIFYLCIEVFKIL